MIRLRVASSLALACSAAARWRDAAQRRAARGDRAVHQPGLLVLSGRPTSWSANTRSDPSVIALTLAVDYWDYLGWKDTLALAGHTNRQRAYASARGDREVYTPQAVINGAVHALGSDKAAIERAIKQIARAAARRWRCRSRMARGRRQADRDACRRPRTRQGPGRGLALPDHQSRCRSRSAAARTAATPSPTATWCGAGSSSATGPARPRPSACR